MPVPRSLVAAVSALALTVPLGLAGAAPAAPAPRPQPAGGEVGSWRVVPLGEGSYRVSWRSPTRLPVTSDRPVVVADGRSLGTAQLGADGRTVRVVVRAPQSPDPASLDVLLSGDRLDVRGDDVTARVGGAAAVRSAAPAATTLPVDPGTPGPYPVVTSDYQLDPVPLPGMAQPIEMVGHVVEPAPGAATGPRPLVLFLHGRHSYCYNPTTGEDGWDWPCAAPYREIPSHLGYDYLQQVLASQGFTTVSVRVNGINAQDWQLLDGGADARAAIVERHLDHWVGLAAAHQVDLSRVVLVGHSRGGEGVDRASLEIPLDAPYTIVGQVLLAPTNFGTQTAAYVPTVTVLPYCDGDVYDLQGQRFTDSARDLTTDDTSLKSSVLVLGANHNYFNTEWTPGLSQAPAWDDWGDPGSALCGAGSPRRLSDSEQRAVGTAYVAGAVRLFTKDEQDLLPLYDGSAARVASTGDAVVLSHAIGGGRELRRPGVDSGLALAVGADTQLCRGSYSWDAVSPHRLCGRDGWLDGNVPHWTEVHEFTPSRRALEVAWSAAGQTGGLVLDDPLDLSTGRLELRTVVDPTVGDVSMRVRLVDSAGASAVLTPEGGPDLAALPQEGGLAKRWAQTVIVDPGTAAGVDLARIAEVDLIGESDAGRVWVLDLAAAPDTLAAVPRTRLPVVSLGRVRVVEGDAASATARVPFTVSGQLTRRAALVVGVVSYLPRVKRWTQELDLAPGQTQGSVVVDYAGNRLDDIARRPVDLVAYPRFGAMTDTYFGRVVVLDDDPTPRVRVRTESRVVREGRPARWTVRLAHPVQYGTEVMLRVVRGPAGTSPLSVGDVPPAWLRDHVDEALPPRTPLWQTHAVVFGYFRPGRTEASFAVPTRRDGRHEGRETLTMRVRVTLPGGRSAFTRTVVVAD
ncbi:MAG TPA: hypothetical protein PLP61_11205 [Nocardioides sp.]|uniref:hypothetical protein n=1 Tax=Nocardioides sp. TaxID=35761 RepID=UPI002D031C24|nr:hypothetical protein [Nocardioides sp.]HQR27597.1 hypothetical protein [Nocardioides sp.]